MSDSDEKKARKEHLEYLNNLLTEIFLHANMQRKANVQRFVTDFLKGKRNFIMDDLPKVLGHDFWMWYQSLYWMDRFAESIEDELGKEKPEWERIVTWVKDAERYKKGLEVLIN